LPPDLVSFLALTAFISLSGVMMPGPVFAVTVAKGQRHPHAGGLIGLGHGLVEIPLIVLIYLGLGGVFATTAWKSSVGLLGGAALLAIGADMIRRRDDLSSGRADLAYGSLGAGMLTTLANPYFYLWWGTVGAALVTRAAAWGRPGLAIFCVVHWLCDLGWSLLVSGTSFKSAGLWSGRMQRFLFTTCGVLLLAFGAWFILGALGLGR
jgi:threonine/homoserine/homoserine lactone efflux protein